MHDLFQIKRVVISTYQSTSGAGKAPMDELVEQTKLSLENKKLVQKISLNKLHSMLFLTLMHLLMKDTLKKK